MEHTASENEGGDPNRINRSEPSSLLQAKALAETEFFDYNSTEVQDYIADVASYTPKKAAIELFYRIRDDIRYNPYRVTLEKEEFQASYITKLKQTYCVPKAILFGACCRALGIPARLGLADVKNHLASPRFLEYLGSDIFAFHGYTELYLDGKWIKATPTFDKKLCEKSGVSPLEFDGTEDSIFHSFDKKGGKFMEYVQDRGIFDDVPYEMIVAGLRDMYPQLVRLFRQQKGAADLGDLMDEIPAQ